MADEDRVFVGQQLMLYSNAIVAFIAAQSLGYSYYFGTNCEFNDTVKTVPHLAGFLAVMLTLAGLLAIAAIVHLGRSLCSLFSSHASLMRQLYIGKAIAVVFFSLLPVYITIAYAIVRAVSNVACAPGA